LLTLYNADGGGLVNSVLLKNPGGGMAFTEDGRLFAKFGGQTMEFDREKSAWKAIQALRGIERAAAGLGSAVGSELLR
jgi:hypothetical protein